MDQPFEFKRLFPNLRWEIVMKMDDRELVNLCRSSNTMENFCNTRDWFWKDRIGARFGINPSDSTVQSILQNNGDNWFRVYFVLVRLNKLKTKLSPYLNQYNLTELYNLRVLSLWYHRLSELPTEIGNLIYLQTLDLGDNQLSEIPTEIGNLTDLQELDLHNNQLSEIPTEIGNLTDLQELDLHNNQLSEIPTEIGNLTDLQHLALSNNQLLEVPTEIGNLTNLRELYLNGNHLSEPNKTKITQLLPNTRIYL